MAKKQPQHSRFENVRLSDGFRTGNLIGKGMFAWVYNGITPSGDKVAIKVPHRLDRQAERRFHREIKVMRELPPNAHCVGYRGSGTASDGTPWLAMEFIDGFTLRSVTIKKKPISERASCALMYQLCEGFAGLHKLGLAHRDIKPDNIMITNADRQVKLMDFGLVQDSQGLLKLFEDEDIVEGQDFGDDLDEGMIAGTPEFMAPEQISDPSLDDSSRRKTDTTADVYSLGVIFYQLLTGRKPFPFDPKSKKPSGYQKEVLAYLDHRLAQEDYDLLRPAEINEELWTVIAKALSKDPKLRQGSAREMGADVEHYMTTGEGVREQDVENTVALDMAAIPELAALAKKVEEGGYGVLSQMAGALPEAPKPPPRQESAQRRQAPTKPARPSSKAAAEAAAPRQKSVRRSLSPHRGGGNQAPPRERRLSSSSNQAVPRERRLSSSSNTAAQRPQLAGLAGGGEGPHRQNSVRISQSGRAKGLTRTGSHAVAPQQDLNATGKRSPLVAQLPDKPTASKGTPWIPIVIVSALLVIVGVVAALFLMK